MGDWQDMNCHPSPPLVIKDFASRGVWMNRTAIFPVILPAIAKVPFGHLPGGRRLQIVWRQIHWLGAVK